MIAKKRNYIFIILTIMSSLKLSLFKSLAVSRNTFETMKQDIEKK